MGRYAANTSVAVETTRAEIEIVLKRYGANQFSYGSDDEKAMAVIQFRVHGRIVRFILNLPKWTDRDVARDKRGIIRSETSKRKWYDQLQRQRWRALLLCIKAKLEAVESNIEDFEEAFLPHIVLPDGKSAAEWLRPQIAIAYETGRMPQSLLALPAPEAE